ncbi:CGNR zinc finger domain-containing protein [Streptomonospora salina]|uniref:Putative RNA-binding Zn ribbon-like protein n=1 Tax=Streptomonospora salina TaxID=104205 RepID=A0A841EN83_9ACTN|nr:CGNR zinc finger domain-containing protein [Streptomonospora salina]MBB6000881.1 putative RNA-binding Zn ribbon-like protein [Streptomonospora salina]
MPCTVNPAAGVEEETMTAWPDASFVGGDPALDFVNTAGGRTKARDTERLSRFTDALDWAHAAAVLDRVERDRLVARADRNPVEAEQALNELREQREALHTFLLAGVEGTECDAGARQRVHSDIATAYREAEPSAYFLTHPAWVVDTAAGARLPSRRLALAASGLLASDRRTHLRVCGRCSWLFLDPSPTRRRRWCSMTTCGNRAKAQRHQQR